MTNFVSREKMSKKARKQADRRRRTLWTVSPVTRKVESKKRYVRHPKHRGGQEE